MTKPVVNLAAKTAATTPSESGQGADAALMEFLNNMREVVAAQRDVLVTYYGGMAPAARAPEAVRARPSPPALGAGHNVATMASHETTARDTAPPATETPMQAATTPGSPASTAPIDFAATLLGIISERTGYPVEVLELDLDLEADLSIDSIKRVEIVVELVDRLKVQVGQANADRMVEGLWSRRTLRGMLEHLEGARELADPRPTPAEIAKVVAPSADGAVPRAPRAAPVLRHLMRLEPARSPERAAPVNGRSFVITDDEQGLAPLVAERLRREGGEVRLVSWAEAQAFTSWRDVDQLVHLWPLHPSSQPSDVQRLFPIMQDVVCAGGGVLAVGGTAIAHVDQAPEAWPNGGKTAGLGGAGLAGMLRCAKGEYPRAPTGYVDLDLASEVETQVEAIVREVSATDSPGEVVYRGGARFWRGYALAPLEADDAAAPREPLLTSDSVVLLTGGARGVTGAFARALASCYGCRIELVGRAALPSDVESDATRGVEDGDLRRVLASRDRGMTLRDVERLAQATLREREMRSTMAAIRASGSIVNYTQLDVRDGDALSAFVAERYEALGRIDGVVHGAGIIEDRSIKDKTRDSFARVFETKVNGALALRRSIRDNVKFVVLYSSIAALHGAEGQLDYACANDTLDHIAVEWQGHTEGHVLTVNWGPWHGAGMVDGALERHFERLQIGLIPLDEGVDALLRELSTGRKADTQVVLMSATADRLSADHAPSAQRN